MKIKSKFPILISISTYGLLFLSIFFYHYKDNYQKNVIDKQPENFVALNSLKNVFEKEGLNLNYNESIGRVVIENDFSNIEQSEFNKPEYYNWTENTYFYSNKMLKNIKYIKLNELKILYVNNNNNKELIKVIYPNSKEYNITLGDSDTRFSFSDSVLYVYDEDENGEYIIDKNTSSYLIKEREYKPKYFKLIPEHSDNAFKFFMYPTVIMFLLFLTYLFNFAIKIFSHEVFEINKYKYRRNADISISILNMYINPFKEFKNKNAGKYIEELTKEKEKIEKEKENINNKENTQVVKKSKVILKNE